MKDIVELKNKDLILNVDYNSLILDLESWEPYLDCLCQGRDYQKEAIQVSVKYLAGQKYNSLKELAQENYKRSLDLKELFKTEKEYLNSFSQFGQKLFANLDLATATGKSYVMYGISQILLSIGLIKKVLILCPSITIEEGLTEKFITLASRTDLINLIPMGLIKIPPAIIDGNSTIQNGNICIENIHAVYNRTGSSISDSLIENGIDTLILNDESHHIFNKLNYSDNDSKKWADFLLDTKYNFKYMLGFTGTAYQGDNYFKDVIYRYSLRNAIEEGFVKNIEYISDSSETIKKENEKFQLILQNHKTNQNLYGNILKPITILITKDIEYAYGLKNKFVDFLIEYDGNKNLNNNTLLEEFNKKVLVITYKSPEVDRGLLKNIDSKDNKVEWIISVSMLNEGWDVKNVFQIVPMEEKAFSSKLLISQVLGRGLRKPLDIINPRVIVMNHDAWGKNIKHLVDEVLELETKIEIKNSVLRDKDHFNINTIDYSKKAIEVEKKQDNNQETKEYNYNNLFNNGVSLDAQAPIKSISLSFENIKSNKNQIKRDFEIKVHTWTLEEVLNKIYSEFTQRNWEGVVLNIDNCLYTNEKLPPRSLVENMIKKSLDPRGIDINKIEEKNVNRILSSFSTILRKTSKTIEYNTIYNQPVLINTKNSKREMFGLSNFRRSEFCLFYSDNYEDDDLSVGQPEVIQYFLEDDSFPRSSSKKVKSELFKTPFTFVVTSSQPEKRFIEELIKPDVSKIINSWIKSKNKGFYSIDYSMKAGSETSKNREYKVCGFNPDFFIHVLDKEFTYILVNEIKADKDLSLENKAKYKYAKKHFEVLNTKLKENNIKEVYIFHMLSPEGYAAYFDWLKDGRLFDAQLDFKCELENLLENL